MVTRLHFIKRAKLLGFSLKGITELLLLRVDAQTSCEEVKQRTEAKIAEVERKPRHAWFTNPGSDTDK